MANPYTPQSISGYNASPPPDDGTQIGVNQLKWSNHIQKIGDPIKTLAESINTAVNTAFATVDDAANLTRGLLPDERLTQNIPRKNQLNVYTDIQRIGSVDHLGSTQSGEPGNATNPRVFGTTIGFPDTDHPFLGTGALVLEPRTTVNGTGVLIRAGSTRKTAFGVGTDGSGNVIAVVDNKTVVTEDSGNFTATLTGFAGTVQGTVQWRRNGNLVMLFAPSAIQGTSDLPTMTMTGIPAALVPNSDILVPCVVLDDIGFVVGAMLAQTTGTFEFYASTISGSQAFITNSSFTNSGPKGLPFGWSASYRLD